MKEPPLSQGVGYGIVLGLGFAFAFGMMLTTYVLKRYRLGFTNHLLSFAAVNCRSRSSHMRFACQMKYALCQEEVIHILILVGKHFGRMIASKTKPIPVVRMRFAGFISSYKGLGNSNPKAVVSLLLNSPCFLALSRDIS